MTKNTNTRSKQDMPFNKDEQENELLGRELLSIDTVVKPKDYVTVNGEPYELMYFDDFGIREQARMNQLLQMVVKLIEGKVDPNQYTIAFKRLKELLQLILPTLPGDLLSSLTDNQMLRIAQAFLADKNRREKEAQDAITNL